MNATYIKVKGKWRYLYCAIDKEGYTLDIQLRKKRDYQAAYTFMKKDFYKRTTHCTVKYLNNLIEQDHRHIKRHFAKSAGFQSIRHASRTLKGIETVHALYKRTRSLQQPNFVSLTYNELQKLLTIA